MREDSGGSRLRDQADLGSQECGKHSRAIALIEKRRDDYIRDYCQVHGDGHWVGTNAQNEYVGELDDIIEMLRSDTPANCPAPVSPGPPANEVSHPSLASAASGMLAALEAYKEHRAKVFHAQMMGCPLPDGIEKILTRMDEAIAAGRAALSKES